MNATERLSWLTALGITLRARDSQWIAAKYDLTVGEKDIAKAAQIPAQQLAAMPETGAQCLPSESL